MDNMTLEHAYQQVYFWRTTPSADWFTCQLFNLMMKADADNKFKLFLAFPAEATAFKHWYDSSDEQEFLDMVKEKYLTESEVYGN